MINKHIQNSIWLYILSMLCLCIGIVIGIYSVKYMAGTDKNVITDFLNHFNSNSASYSIDHKTLFIETLKSNMPIIISIWFLGMTMIGLPVILAIDILKGFTVGFTVSLIINSFGMKGVLFSFLTVIPQNIIYIPCIIFASVISMKYCIMIFKNKSGSYNNHNFTGNFGSYSVIFLIISVIMAIGFLYEIYITPGIITSLIANTGSVKI